MFSQRIAVLVLATLLAISAFNAGAQVSPAKTVVNLGGLGLAGASGSSAPIAGGATAIDQPINVSSMNNSTSINESLNSSLANIPLLNSSATKNAPSMQPIDLSRYSQDRRSKNLTGYTNIMYPFAEARGSTVSTAGSGGGCGCG